MKEIKIFDNFFTEECLDKINKKLDLFVGKEKIKSALFSLNLWNWEEELIQGSFPILRHSLVEEDDEILRSIRGEVQKKIDLKVGGVVIHFFTKMSYIPWHSDAGYGGALTIYMNRKWDPNWGGFLLYREGDEIKAIIPEYNKAVYQKGGVPHCVTPVNMSAGEMRMSIQVFLQKENNLI